MYTVWCDNTCSIKKISGKENIGYDDISNNENVKPEIIRFVLLLELRNDVEPYYYIHIQTIDNKIN